MSIIFDFATGINFADSKVQRIAGFPGEGHLQRLPLKDHVSYDVKISEVVQEPEYAASHTCFQSLYAL